MGNALGSTVKEDIEVGLVAKHEKVIFDADIGQPFHFFKVGLGAGRVMVVVVDEKFCPRRDLAFYGFEIKREPAPCFLESVGSWHSLVEVDHRFVDREPGVRVEDFIAGVHKSHDEFTDHRFPAGLDAHVVGIEFEPPGPGDLLGHSLSQRRDTRGGAVSGLAFSDGPDSSLYYVFRGRDVKIPQVKGVNFHPGGRQTGRFGPDGKSRLCS